MMNTRKGFQGSNPAHGRDSSAPSFLSPYHSGKKSTSNPHVNQQVRFHHDGHATGKRRSIANPGAHKVDVFNKTNEAYGLVHAAPSKKRMGYDTRAISASSNLRGCGLVGPQDTSKITNRPTRAVKVGENEQFRFFYKRDETSHKRELESHVYSQVHDHVWKHFKDTSISKDAPVIEERKQRLKKKTPVPDIVHGVKTVHTESRKGKKFNPQLHCRDFNRHSPIW